MTKKKQCKIEDCAATSALCERVQACKETSKSLRKTTLAFVAMAVAAAGASTTSLWRSDLAYKETQETRKVVQQVAEDVSEIRGILIRKRGVSLETPSLVTMLDKENVDCH